MRKILYLFILIYSLVFSSCFENSIISTKEQPLFDNMLLQTETEVFFQDTFLDLGNIKEGEKKNFAFKIKNIGKYPLFLKSVNTSCGCTVVDYPKDPIKSNVEQEILGQFDSKNKKGAYIKNLSIDCNTKERFYNLKFKINVL